MRRALLAIVTTSAALVLLLGFKTHPATSLANPPAAISGTGGTTSSGSDTTGTTSAPTPSASASTKSSTSATRTVTGDAASTRYGPVQVQVTLSGNKITSVTAIDYPANDPRDYQINSYAIPILNQEAVNANSANIDMVSGATFTSMGYVQSLQSALDKAGV